MLLEEPTTRSTLSAALRLFSIPELADVILSYLQFHDICSLRLVCSIARDACTDTIPRHRWFFKDVKCIHSQRANPILNLPDNRESALLVRSLEMELPPYGLCREMFDFGDQAILQCSNLAVLSYKNARIRKDEPEKRPRHQNDTNSHYNDNNVKSHLGDGELDHGNEEDGDFDVDRCRMARQLMALAPRLKKLRVSMWKVKQRNKDDNTNVVKWWVLEDLDRFWGTILMAGQSSRPSFQSLQVLDISGWYPENILPLKWTTLVRCLRQMPVLRDLSIVLMELQHDDDVGEHTNDEFPNIEKLEYSSALPTEVAPLLVNAFPCLQDLSINDIVHLWTRDHSSNSTDTATTTSTSNCDPWTDAERTEMFWTPFPRLRRLSINNNLDAMASTKSNVLSLSNLPLPNTLVELEIGTFKRPANLSSDRSEDNYEGRLTIQPGMVLNRLTIKNVHINLGADLLSQECCNRLTHLSIMDDVRLLRLLLLPDGNINHQSTSLIRNNPEAIFWDIGHLDGSFIKSRFGCVAHLRSLQLTGKCTVKVTSRACALGASRFLNRLLRNMPSLEEFMMDDPADCIGDLFYQMGRGDAGEASHCYLPSRSKDETEPPYLRSISLQIRKAVQKTEEVESALQSRFPSLREVKLKYAM
ncbi:hypothetical protein EDD21DRAFT_365612 [Dissophora ornata]|nr:hypothetical protein BGZ58_005229 [Dissophora ornata]KAI8604676.1 hypothetical protein EDD21DRAFT_365612 [Dissophora ornata]